MEEKIQRYQENIFESIKHIDENGVEYWKARELMKVLQYSKWQNFKKIIDKAQISCKMAKNNVEDLSRIISLVVMLAILLFKTAIQEKRKLV